MNKPIVINNIDVTELTLKQIVSRDKYDVADLFMQVIKRLELKESEFDSLKEQYDKITCLLKPNAKKINLNCPYLSYTDWGLYACKLYKSDSNDKLIKTGLCESNEKCYYKAAEFAKQNNYAYKKIILTIESLIKKLKEEIK